MTETIQNETLVAKCGLYCGNCKSFKKGKCKGCDANLKASWCKIRSCCIEKNIATCAQCDEFESTKDCKKHNATVAKVFSVLFNSDRHACIDYIRSNDLEIFEQFMIDNNYVTMPLRKRK